ncbi:MAG: ATP-dependent DNA helicase RecG [Desulfuromonadales bacterium C00003096]|jgi:ATP-dependent DNA helicase RecG|nr:MAG: ATP-dependent DNA helicase RecG [Desulfuromonadales bacterium C00003096]
MKTSIKKLRKFFRLEAEREYDNKAVMGGLANILSSWELEAREDQLPEQIIQAVISRLRDYHRLSEESREVALKGIWKRVNKGSLQEKVQDQVDEAKPPTDKPTPPPQQVSEPPAQIKKPSQPEQKKPQKEETVSPPAEKLDFDTPVDSIKGIGEKKTAALTRMGISSIKDLLYTFPRRHDDYSKLKPIGSLWFGEEITVIGTIDSVSTRSVRGGKMKLVEAVVSDKSGALRVTWFNQPWLEGQLSRAKHVVLSGEIEQYLGRLTMNNPEWEPLSKEQLHTNRIVPVYPLTKDITQKWLRKVLHDTVQKYGPSIEDPLPDQLRSSISLPKLSNAIREIHFPDSDQSLQKAKQRLAFDELFLLQMGVLKQKKQWENRPGQVFDSPDVWMNSRLEQLPFQLTKAQIKTLTQVREDLRSGHPMNRLLQGDVGSGKTVIAALAALIVIRQGAQAAFLAPTSILAEQHFQSLKKLLGNNPDEVKENEISLLIGSTPEDQKEQIRKKLSQGEIKLVIGTHALLQEPVEFQNLQLAIIDEQHRFGVEQRGTLRQKGNNPHLLVMTATPIPRSLALTTFGDLEISAIDELPPGRLPVETHVLYPREIERAYSLVRRQVDKGNQAFIIYPLVEESDKSDEKAAVEEFSRLQKEIFPTYSLGLLHGQMRPDEKESVMTLFRDKEIQILVSTSVVEVGVDIPGATVMLIEGAHRFGLAQLHQFRGRVGRSDQKSYCILIPGSAEEVENQRLQAMVKTNDGFVLAEKDLAIRGPGQFLGTRQSGYTELKLASITDLKLVEQARQHASDLFRQDPDLSQENHQKLALAVNQFWTQKNSGDIS